MMRMRTNVRLQLIRRLLLAALFAIPLYTGYVAFGAYSATAQADKLVTQSVAVENPSAKQPVEEVDVAAETTPETAPAPTASQAAAPAPAPAPVRAAPAVDRLVIPSIGLNSQLVSVGLTGAGAVDVHPSLAGWWNGSAQPGTPGAAFIDGHSPGVLSPLTNIGTGAHISVNKADGQVYNYTVVFRETVALSSVDMRKALSVYGGAAEGLNLMTCAGTYIPSLGTTDQRLIVYAVRS